MKLLEFRPKLFDCLKNYSKRTFASDLMAGIIVGIVALPLAIAFGIASGVSPRRASSRPSSPDWSSRYWEEAAYRSEGLRAHSSSSYTASSSNTARRA